MKKFIIGGLIGMLVALVMVVVVWLFLQDFFLVKQSAPVLEPPATTSTETSAPSSSPAPTSAAADTATPAVEPDTTPGVPAADLPLSEGQRALAESLGLDVDQIVISEELVTCAREKLGESRYQQILAGDTPNFLETAKLLPCLGQ
ncbi:hypothetical protein CL655_03975 [bacterium]|nr:hypothetical protein [bacterium]|tara:strand:+ start:1098 stop:1535 length:438 start_codon:yes stop_codon:yes gene_type:complete